MKYYNFQLTTEEINTHPHLKYVTKCLKTVDEKYQILFDELNGYKHLRIIRCDKQPIHNYMDILEIKNDLFGENIIAIEVYPKKDDFIDGSNTYHIWTWNNIKVPNLSEMYNYNLKKSE